MGIPFAPKIGRGRLGTHRLVTHTKPAASQHIRHLAESKQHHMFISHFKTVHTKDQVTVNTKRKAPWKQAKMSTPHQRKKKDKVDVPKTSDNKNTTTAKPGNPEEKISLTEQLDRAQAAVERSHEGTLKLHQQWRTQLFRLSFLVMVVTMHIAQAPSGACIKEIKKWNELQPETRAISGSEAFLLVLHDATVELLSIVCIGCLLQCLRLPNGDFSSLPYRLSCAILPVIISIYFQQSYSNNNNTSSNNKKERPTCVASSKYYDASLTTADLRDEAVPRHFPVALVFHLIVSISLWFMLYQNQQHDKNVQLLQKLKHDLVQAKKNKANNTPAAATTSQKDTTKKTKR